MAWQEARRGEPPPPRWSDRFVCQDREVKPETLAYLYGSTRKTVILWAKRLGILELRWPPTPKPRDYRYKKACRRCWYVIRAENLPRIHMLFLPELQRRGVRTAAGLDPGLFRSAPPRRRLAELSKASAPSFLRRYITRSTALLGSAGAPNGATAPTPPSAPTTPPAD